MTLAWERKQQDRVALATVARVAYHSEGEDFKAFVEDLTSTD